MTMYDVKFYGVHFYYESEFSDVSIYATKEEAHPVPGFSNRLFEVVVLKEHEGQQDVLKLEFEDGTCEYKTLYAPYLYFDDGKWRKAPNASTPEEFMKAYLKMLLND